MYVGPVSGLVPSHVPISFALASELSKLMKFVVKITSAFIVVHGAFTWQSGCIRVSGDAPIFIKSVVFATQPYALINPA